MLSCSYIKPQRTCAICQALMVVCYHVPTSNHNYIALDYNANIVVCYHVPTSNHNCARSMAVRQRLYVIMFLHQTTTYCSLSSPDKRCMLSCSYIKPQHAIGWRYGPEVVCYHVPTSNHNCTAMLSCALMVVCYHVPTSNHNNSFTSLVLLFVVCYHVPTSNHNLKYRSC